MKKVFLVWGIKKEANAMPAVVGTFQKEADAWKCYNDIPCSGWRWLDVKKMEIK